MILFHGISAFRGARKPLEQIKAVSRCFGNEICVADRPIGPIGILAAGEITAAYSCDVWSYVSDGKRQADDDLFNNFWIESPDSETLADPIELEKWVRYVRSWPENRSDYCEFFMRVKSIAGIWIKGYVNETTRKVARVLSRKYNVPLHDVERHTRPWEITGYYYDNWERAADIADSLGIEW